MVKWTGAPEGGGEWGGPPQKGEAGTVLGGLPKN